MNELLFYTSMLSLVGVELWYVALLERHYLRLISNKRFIVLTVVGVLWAWLSLCGTVVWGPRMGAWSPLKYWF